MFEIRKEGFFMDGKPFRLYSGAMHYFRVVPAYWRDRFAKMRAAGFNAVETVMCWNMHEPEEGRFCFEGNYDIVAYCKAAWEFGLYVIIRPGPYTCAEWDFGGLPAWLLKDKNLRIRCNDPSFTEKTERYFREVMKRLAPLQITRGGNLIALQIENEYGSYGNDKEYLTELVNILRKYGAEVPFFTSDGTSSEMLSGGTLPGVYKTLNFGSRADKAFDCLKGIQDDLPRTCMEFWCGWFDHWGEIHHRRNPRSVAGEIEKLVTSGANLNIYMFHGGTNFGFTAGANFHNKYQPTVTSYDDAALLNEYGDYTEAYMKVRSILRKARGLDMSEPLPPRPELQNIGRVKLTARADLWRNLYLLGKRHRNATPENMEYFGQNSGYILYCTKLKGKYGANRLIVEGVRDVAYVRINGQLKAKYDRSLIKGAGTGYAGGSFSCRIPAFDGEMQIEILVEGMGRVNYGHETENDRKGIRKVRLGYQTLFGWDIYTLPMDNLSETDFSLGACGKTPSIYKGEFKAEKGKDCFADTSGFGKGFILVNGFNIGRYRSCGPQRTLYIPAPILRENNEIMVVEQECRRLKEIKITDKHRL